MQLNSDDLLDDEVLAGLPEGPLGVAVSGGGDSVALLYALHERGGRDLAVATVDHGLRTESRAEAEAVGTLARSMGYSHEILTWTGWNKRGNLQDAARTARRDLLTAWAQRLGIGSIAIGHTADDQAETFLMRLARGSGVEGLSSMDTVTRENGINWVRPLLGTRRAQLRDYLGTIGAAYVDDPTNEDETFERVRIRRALGTLNALGIDVPNINKTTNRLRSAKQVIYTACRDLSLAASTVTGAGVLEIELERFQSAERTIRLRIMSEAVRFVSGSYYAPRAYMVEGVLDRLDPDFSGATLHGSLLRVKDGRIVICREPGKAENPVPAGQIWDGRWNVTGPIRDGLTVAALGDAGLQDCPDWRATGYAREHLVCTPAVFENGVMIAAPVAGQANGWHAEISLKNPFFSA